METAGVPATAFTFKSSQYSSGGPSADRPSSAASSSKSWRKKKTKQVDIDGRTPEEVHDLRYSGIRMDMSSIDLEDPAKTSLDPVKQALANHRAANEAAAQALTQYKILLPSDLRDKLQQMEGKFDDMGSEIFSVMHMMPAYLSSRPDHAPIELTVVRVRLSCGVEKDAYHVFPSPLPLPLGKSADYKAGEKEYHEIDESEFQLFDDDYIHILYQILVTLNPQCRRKNLSGRFPKFPLVVCKSHQAHQNVMMFEYLHQRALLAQKGAGTTKAPADFVVPEKLSIAFCDIGTFDLAIRSVLRALDLNVGLFSEEVDERYINHCSYHQTKNKLTCTTYCASEVVEHMLVFSPFWSADVPNRFVQPYNLDLYVDRATLQTSMSSNLPFTPDSMSMGGPQPSKSASIWSGHDKTAGTLSEEGSSEFGETVGNLPGKSGQRTISTYSPDRLSRGRAGSHYASSYSDEPSSSSIVTGKGSQPGRRLQHVPRSAAALAHTSPFKGDGSVEGMPLAEKDGAVATPSPTPMAASGLWESGDSDSQSSLKSSQSDVCGPKMIRQTFRPRTLVYKLAECHSSSSSQPLFM